MEEPLEATANIAARRLQLMSAIQNDNYDLVQALVDQLSGVNISEPELKAKLPKHVHQIATTCMTSPLRISISYRRLKSMEYILNSPCVITDNDKSLALQKILVRSSYKTVEDHLDQVKYIRSLIKHGAVVKNSMHISTALHNSFNTDRCVFDALVSAFLQEGNNKQKGLLLLAFCLKDRNPRPGSAAKQLSSREWEETREKCTRDIFMSGFDPDKYISDDMDIYNMNDTARLMQVLPDLLQMCTTIDNVNVANILRKTAFHYPLINVESRHIMGSMCEYLFMLGYNIGVINDIAKCPQQFNERLGFTKAGNTNQVYNLQDMCRIKIRSSITEPNVLLGVQKLKLPSRLGSYCLMAEMTEAMNDSKMMI